ncbi:hypothetical protein OsccyDRAFT_4597 [Leptolyngbyaceae cyanobacterium JSC-12]|nr:hypothetical protein OsccyDRAFT_4597 [Leptolyngbyaceae cyanobacterium JSC-12]
MLYLAQSGQKATQTSILAVCFVLSYCPELKVSDYVSILRGMTVIINNSASLFQFESELL